MYGTARGRLPKANNTGARYRDMACYDVIVIPDAPLKIGERVEIRPITEVEGRNGRNGIQGARHYVVERAEVKGKIVGIRAMEKEVTEFIVKNDEWMETAEHALVSVQHVQGVTVDLGWWGRLVRWALSGWALTLRRIPLETEFVLIERGVRTKKVLGEPEAERLAKWRG